MGAVTMKDLGIDRMPAEHRMALALEILDSLGRPKSGSSLPAELFAELRRRDAEMDADPASVLTWEQIRSSVEKRP